MYVGKDYTVAEPGEIETYTLDFANDVSPGEVVNSVSFVCELAAGSDPTPSACLIGQPVVTPPTQCSQFCSFTITGNTYRLHAIAQTSFGQTLKLYSHVLCQTAS